ncbi:MAG: radical SAM protein [Candidatus Omnitrophota bacterium]|jgi:wyosine [tRNA(Phe)-imidazoG37] synthetase (radical SAM superfamily)
MRGPLKYIYGPVPSWRLGSSLGIDLLSQEEKICNFDCVYCQIGPTSKFTVERKAYVAVKNVIEELSTLPSASIDYITFSGRGEPTLAANLGEAIKAVKSVRKERVAVLTNGSLIGLEEVREELVLADFVVVKLDACSPETLQSINRPAKRTEFGEILEGIKKFRESYMGRLALQIMFIGKQKKIDEYAYLSNCINPNEVQINTPLRHCNIKPLTKEDIFKIKDYFICACKGINIVSAYDENCPKVIKSISDEDTLRRRGKVK